MNLRIITGVGGLVILTAIRLSFAAEVPFRHVAIDDSVKDPWAKIVADIDRDGFPDIIIGGRAGPLVWYHYPDWKKTVIAKGGYRTVDGEAGDIDGDGDLDIVMGGLIWYENPLPRGDPAKSPWTAHQVADHKTHDIELADLDKDGRLDIVTRDQSDFGAKAGDKVYLWRQEAGDQWSHKIIACPHGEGLAVSDLDRDGDPDVVIGGLWFENDGRILDGAWRPHRFGDWHPNASVEVADLNGDGRPDIVLSPSELKGNWYHLSWFEAPAEPRQGGWTEHVIVERIECVIHGLATADFDGDGAMDIAASEMHQGEDPDEVILFLNRDQGATWDKQVLSTKGSHCIQAADIGADGDMDLVGANWSGPYQPVELWENQSSGWVHLSSIKGDLPAAHVGQQAASLILDIDKDGVNDFVVAGWSDQTSMAWFRRTAAGWQRYLIDNRKSHIDAGGTCWDMDGDLDILQKDFQHDQRVDIWLNGGTRTPRMAQADYECRVPLRVRAAGFARRDAVVEVPLDLTQQLRHRGPESAGDKLSVRVVEIDGQGTVLNAAVPAQFDRDPDSAGGTAARGTLTFLLGPRMEAEAERLFYADLGLVPRAGSPPPESSLVSVTDGVDHEGQESFQIRTPNATYYYHKQGAGFASLEDRDGNDWLSYNPGEGPVSKSGSGGKYRGLPNLVHPEGCFHPGNDQCTSRLLAVGPVKATLASESRDGAWACRWDIFPYYARLTVLKADHPYWFLYEGTPGGRLDEDSDYCVRGDGTRTPAATRWEGNLSVAGEAAEWLYFGDAGMNRVLYLVHEEDDGAVDSYWPMNHEMTVFGFGRRNLEKHLERVPAHFLVGFCESQDFGLICQAVQSACRPLAIMVGDPQTRPQPAREQ